MLSNEVIKMEQECERLKLENEELRRILGREPEKPMDCQSCAFFIQHYVYYSASIGGGDYTKLNFGHCTQGMKIKHKAAKDKTCQFFVLGKEFI